MNAKNNESRDPTADTIVAPATPHGRSAVGIVRLSGRRSIEIVKKISTESGGIDKKAWESNKIRHVKIKIGKKVLDDALIMPMLRPRSYTGEDVVEIHCHGSPYIIGRIVSECVRLGAVIAEPGEFTRRAYLNGKMDLSQAEAVADIINSNSEAAAICSMRVLSGELRNKITGLRDMILKLLSDLEARLEFLEEEDVANAPESVAQELDILIQECGKLSESYKTGRILKHGLKVVLAGKQNAGKSSLFNRLIGCDKAIVDAMPGTTRDAVEQAVDMDGIQILLVDTAGAGAPGPHASIYGKSLKRAVNAMQSCDLAIFVADCSREWNDEDNRIKAAIKKAKKGIIAFNKTDLEPCVLNKADIVDGMAWESVAISALNGYGIDDLKTMISSHLKGDNTEISSDALIITNIRHAECLGRCLAYVMESDTARAEGYGEEIVAIGLKKAADTLDEITGGNSSKEVLDLIFSNFCIGK